MYLYNKPHPPPPIAPGEGTAADTDAASTGHASPQDPGDQEDREPSPGPSSTAPGLPPPSTTGLVPESSFKTAGSTSFPLSFPPLFFQRSKTPSASLAPSTAEGKPVPLTDTIGSQHTSALQKLNSKYPSAVRRPGYAASTGAQSSTYSQPVIVRTYSGPPPSQGSRSTRSTRHRPPSSSRGVSRRVPLPSSSIHDGAGFAGQAIQPTVSDVGVGITSSTGGSIDGHRTETDGGNARLVSMPRPYKPKKATSSSSKLSLPWQWYSGASRQEPEEPKLPPLEAFSFKSFMADLEDRGSQNDIGADLDRIAEICARSRYSLSNQYEVHVAPHGSGASFASGIGSTAPPRRKGPGHSHTAGGPTLQPEDESSARSHPRRRNGGGRRRSAAYSTLETIMSSSRSSEEEKTKKKSAAELVGEVRGRAARKAWDTNNPTASTSASASASTSASASAGNGSSSSAADAQQAASADSNSKLARKKSASFATAIMDNSTGGRASSATSGRMKNPSSSSSSNTRQRTKHTTASSSSTTTTTTSTPSALLSDPALPQTSTSHLGVRTAGGPAGSARSVSQLSHRRITPRPPPSSGSRTPVVGSSSWSAWIPSWGTGQAQAQQARGSGTGTSQRSHAEGSLRELLGRSATAGGGAGRDGQAELGR